MTEAPPTPTALVGADPSRDGAFATFVAPRPRPRLPAGKLKLMLTSIGTGFAALTGVYSVAAIAGPSALPICPANSLRTAVPPRALVSLLTTCQFTFGAVAGMRP